MPLVGLMLAPAGNPASNEYVSVWAGRSASTAELVKVRRVPSSTVLFPICARSEVVGDANGYLIAARPLGFGGRPTENAVGGVDACSGRKARVQSVSESLGGQVGVSG